MKGNDAKGWVIAGVVVAGAYVAYRMLKPVFDAINALGRGLSGAVDFAQNTAKDASGPTLAAFSALSGGGCNFKPQKAYLDMSGPGGDKILAEGFISPISHVPSNVVDAFSTWALVGALTYPSQAAGAQATNIMADVRAPYAYPGLRTAYKAMLQAVSDPNVCAQRIYAACGGAIKCNHIDATSQQAARNVASSIVFQTWSQVMGIAVTLKPLH